ncbi:MAG: lysophospholipid acyltransferase (LPLAT)-like uncharacterized protein [bacterium]|jgi:lysophospholipid acyltransferase (LPLAT)-like uncharacterized protein
MESKQASNQKQPFSWKGLKKNIIIFLFSRILFFIFRLFSFTYRYQWIGDENKMKAKKQHRRGAFIVAGWHENSWSLITSHIGEPIAPLISSSKDGEVATYVAKKVGFIPIRGSSTRGGKGAREELLDHLSRGYYSSIVIDGPQGPRRQPKAGVIDIAKKSGASILPITAMSTRQWVLRKAWDQTRIPKPFSKIIIIVGEPIQVPNDVEGEEFEKYLTLLQKKLNEQEEQIQTLLI